MKQRKVLHRNLEPAPDHAPGLLPAWLAEHRVEIVIAAGLGARARDLLAGNSVEVLTGVSAVDPEVLVSDFVNGRLECRKYNCPILSGNAKQTKDVLGMTTRVRARWDIYTDS
jgi:predicted Fe-Mo cluster-binding NifX family protein